MSEQKKPLCHIVVVGHVDHGKSTLIGRMLYDTDSLPEGKYEELKAVSEKRGTDIEWSFALDALQAERNQAVTIDTTQIFFKTDKRPYVIIDAPGHKEFIKNMISGASLADGAVLVVDARDGLQEQTRRHAYLLHLLGIRQVVVSVNKMDLVDYKQERYQQVQQDVEKYLEDIGVSAMAYVPISARKGEGIASVSEHMPWYEGGSVLDLLDGFSLATSIVDQPLRFSVQDIYREGHDKRKIIGRVETGVLRKGDRVVLSPSNQTATVASLCVWPEDESKVKALAGEAIGFTLDKPLFVERGDIVSHDMRMPKLSNAFQAHLFWLSEAPLVVGEKYKMKIMTREVNVIVREINKVVNTEDLSSEQKAEAVHKNDVAEVTFESREMIALDSWDKNIRSGRCAFMKDYEIVGGGILNVDDYPDQRAQMFQKTKNLTEVDHLLDYELRSMRNGHKGSVIWFTGLSGSGKSTLAMQVEQHLFQKGYQVYVLDGDNVRMGLNADLGFSPEDRAENIRRIGAVASLMADAGFIVISAFISPYKSDRQRAREAAKGRFHELHIKASVETCEERDPKGLYKKARAGEIAEFTGVSAPYEAPDSPELVVDTENLSVDGCVETILNYVEKNIRLKETGDGSVKVAS